MVSAAQSGCTGSPAPPGWHIHTCSCKKVCRYYNTKYAEKSNNLTDAERPQTSEALLAMLRKQQVFFFFTRCYTSRVAAVKTSFVISHKIAQNSKPFSEVVFIQECLLICPEKKEVFVNVLLSRRTVTRMI